MALIRQSLLRSGSSCWRCTRTKHSTPLLQSLGASAISRYPERESRAALCTWPAWKTGGSLLSYVCDHREWRCGLSMKAKSYTGRNRGSLRTGEFFTRHRNYRRREQCTSYPKLLWTYELQMPYVPHLHNVT